MPPSGSEIENVSLIMVSVQKPRVRRRPRTATRVLLANVHSPRQSAVGTDRNAGQSLTLFKLGQTRKAYRYLASRRCLPFGMKSPVLQTGAAADR